MANAITGAFSGDKLTVDTMVGDPTFIPSTIREDLDRSFLTEAIFRNGGPNNGVVAYAEAVSPFLVDDAEEVAEYGEIPLSTMKTGKWKSVIGIKTALGISVSLEQRRFNKIDQVSQQVTALKNTMTRTDVRACLDAFDKANAPTLNVTSWEDPKADPLKDIRSAKRMVREAKPEGVDEQKFGYKADTLVISESVLEAALDHENTQKFFRATPAEDNPIFKGILPQSLVDLQIVTSSWLDEDEIYVMESGAAGFYSDGIPLTVTDLYAPNGDNGYGGTTQSWRIDAFRHRVIAVDNPKAVVKITGAIS